MANALVFPNLQSNHYVEVVFKKIPDGRTISLLIRNQLTEKTAFSLMHILAHLPKTTKNLNATTLLVNPEVLRVLPKSFVIYVPKLDLRPRDLPQSSAFMLEFIRATEIVCEPHWSHGEGVVMFASTGRPFCNRLNCSVQGETKNHTLIDDTIEVSPHLIL
jgi:hypothetical protein